MMKTRGYGRKAAILGLILCLAMGGAAGIAEDARSTSNAVLEGMGASDTILDIGERMADADSMTIDAQIAVRQNGEDFVTGTALYQFAGDDQYMRAEIAHASGEAAEMEQSTADGTRVMRKGDDYYSMPIGDEADEDDDDLITSRISLPEDTAGYMGTVLGQLFGVVTEKMTVTEDGIGLHLAGEEVPAILNLVLSMADGHTAEAPARTILHGTRGVAAEPKADDTLSLGSSLRIDRIDLDVAMEGDYVSGIQCSIVLTGVDAEGATVETELASVIRISDVNATTPDVVDTTGVEMTPIESPRGGMRFQMPGAGHSSRFARP